MSGYDFIIETIRFSYSSLSNFENCAYGWKLSYIDDVEKAQNFFAEYGLLTHDVFEKYFLDKLTADELSDYYKNNYDKIVKHSPPRYPQGLEQRYKDEGQIFFDFFPFDKSNYDVLAVEASIILPIDGINFIAKPDLVLRDKNTGRVCLVDYKTSYPFRKSKSGALLPDKKKLEKYYQQMYIYTYALNYSKGLVIDEIMLWFPRADLSVVIPWSKSDEETAIKWLTGVVDKIKTEEVFDYGKPGEYFCHYLCSVRRSCKFGE
jgi:hypothetical protein